MSEEAAAEKVATAKKKASSKRKSAPIETPEPEPVGVPKTRRRRHGDMPFWPS